MRQLLFCLCLLIAAKAVYPQQKIRYDSSAVSIRKFNAAAINQYKADPAFSYERTPEPVKSLWDRFWEYFWQKVTDIWSTEAGRTTFTVVLVVISAAVLIYFVAKVLGMSNSSLFGKKNLSDSLHYSLTQDDIHGIHFDRAIQEAVERKDFRLAVRLLYLQSLKLLADTGLIDWKINKTNVAYVQELMNQDFQHDFRVLTFQFENNWYGDKQIGEREFTEVKQQFGYFNSKISAL